VQRAAHVALYAALPDELPTRLLFEGLVEAGVPVLLPRTTGDRALVFCRVERWSDLEASGRHRVLEPPEGSLRVQPAQGDVVMVPGVAFDADGWRLGRGAGYYDRAFPPDGDEPPLLFGLAYAFQLVRSLPHGSRDRRMDVIVTERGVLRVQGAGS
jgi:5-formyltetrahydrofolate cyclo-ligase